MSYTVLARRYRSAAFDQVVGQEPIARTLQNAITRGRVAHAYLFTGTRGVGKTSMARLLARALNCPDTIPDCPRLPAAQDDQEAFTYPPLDVQERMAQAIMRGDDLNVIEIDGASNNSVDNARQLIAGAGLSPTAGARFKVYIIDEVHMLSTAAFNALLKTMEEPPAHVKFILCTTETHKVPVTIQSRCQRFDFRAIPTAKIAAHLSQVLQNENIPVAQAAGNTTSGGGVASGGEGTASGGVVFQIARLGNGSMRDALSLLDRLIAAAGAEGLSEVLLEQVLGVPPLERVAQLVDAIADGDVKAVLQQTAGLLQDGIAQDQLLDVLIERLRTLMLLLSCGVDSDLIELPDVARPAALAQARRFDVPALVYMIAVCDQLQRAQKFSTSPRALLEAAMVRLALAEKMADVSALLSAPPGSATAPAPGSAALQKKK